MLQPRADEVLTEEAASRLLDLGFVVIPGPVPRGEIASLVDAYEVAVASAAPADVSIGRTTTRVDNLVNRGPAFDAVYVYPPLLDACCRVVRQDFKLSTMLARTLRPDSPDGELHVDFEQDAEGYPMVGFILMVDDFRPDNGATRFVPRSHAWTTVPEDVQGQVLACGSAGSLIIYNGSIWHGHTANTSGQPRRSIQGACIWRSSMSGGNLPARMTPETLARISPRARYLLGV